MKSNALFSSALLVVAAVAIVGCTTERVVVREPAQKRVVVVKDAPSDAKVVVVRTKPPRPRREMRTRRPSARHVWVAGHWQWRASKYVWVSGRWVTPPRHGARWVAGHWKKRHGGWVWVAGYWKY